MLTRLIERVVVRNAASNPPRDQGSDDPKNDVGLPFFGRHQASAIHLQAATVSGVQIAAATTAITSIGLVLSAFTVAAGAPSPHH